VKNDGVASYRNYYVAEKVKSEEDLFRYLTTLGISDNIVMRG